MKIRSITYFFQPDINLKNEGLRKAEEFIKSARPSFEQGGYEVQTARLAAPSLERYMPGQEAASLLNFARLFETEAASHGYDYVSLGPATPHFPGGYALIPEVLAATQNVFLSGMLSTPLGGVSLPAVRACAQVIQRAASISPDGFANLRFAALANVPPGSPFFPAAYHAGGAPIFALATEAADLAVSAFEGAGSLDQARQDLVQSLEGHARQMTGTAHELAKRFGVTFGGIDFSLAPFPEESRSLGKAMERLGAPAVGLHGSLAAAAILADTIDRANFPRAGFSGLMLPVLEDAILAARAAEGLLSVKDLLLYSAVCGTGLDTVPLPGDATQEQLASVLLDLACLAQRLDKPLTARLMPVPGKVAGAPTGFDFAFFANSRVLALNSAPLQGYLAGDESFALSPKKSLSYPE